MCYFNKMPHVRALLLSFHHAEALADALRVSGTQVKAVKRAGRLHEHLRRETADLVVVDGRGESHALIEAVALAKTSAPILAIVDRTSPEVFKAVIEAGATSVLGAPFIEEELSAALFLLLSRVSGIVEVEVPAARTTDNLTGATSPAPAKLWLTEYLSNGPVTLMMVSPADFNMVNDAFGNDSGDVVLRAIVKRIQRIVGEHDAETLVARLGGTKIAVALAGEVSQARIMLLAQAILDVVERPFSDGEQLIQLGGRIGIVRSKRGETSTLELIRRAKASLTTATKSADNRIAFMTSEEGSAAEFVQSLHSDLRAALAGDEIDILFQPQVSIGDGRILGVEALARWQHPIHGELGAAMLFAVAEQSGYLLELSRHVQERAIALASRWPESLSALRLAINVTGLDMGQHGFQKEILGYLEKHQLPVGRLTVEITETLAMRDLDGAAKTLSQLRSAGCRVAIDDFGTGYSSLAWLKSLPADYLKIDKGLADDINRSAKARKVVKSLISLARSLGMTVIAEGVETEDHLRELKRAGCSIYQGYLCAPALDSVALEQLMLVKEPFANSVQMGTIGAV